MKMVKRKAHVEPPPRMAPGELRALAQRAHEAAAELHAATDRLNMAINECARTLADLNLGVSAQVPMEPGAFLSFRKFDNRWTFVVDEGEYETELVRATRAVRLQAVPFFEQLAVALLKAAWAMLATVKKSTSELDALLARLKGP